MGGITAWRYWTLRNDGYDFTEKQHDWILKGDIESWDGPSKEAGVHVPSYTSILFAGGPREPHLSPQPDCLCGVNAVRRIRSRDLLSRLSGPAVVFAQVELGGRVEEYEEGFRAEQALIAGPIYVLDPPEGDGWREGIERRYGQPVIEQSSKEALEWVRKDEEANGHRETHQDARTGPTGSAYKVGGTIPVSTSLAADFTRAFTRASGRTSPSVGGYRIVRGHGFPYRVTNGYSHLRGFHTRWGANRYILARLREEVRKLEAEDAP